jgi:cell division protein FtsQ
MATRRSTRTTAPAGSAELPPDVRLMRTGAALLFVLGTVLVAAVLVLWAARAPVFTIRHIALDGDLHHNTATTVRAVAVPKLAGNYFSIDLQQARQAFESVPWVRHALVRRVWPNRLAVTLQEHRPAAFWQRDEDEDALVNTQGEVFEVNLGDVDSDELPRLRGPEGSAAQVLAMHRELAPVLQPLHGRLEALSLSVRGSWQAKFASRSVVELGRGSAEEVIARARRYAGTLPQLTARYEGRLVERADLRHRDSYAVRIAGVDTFVEPPKPGAKPPQNTRTTP